jgi:hypothetical protein
MTYTNFIFIVYTFMYISKHPFKCRTFNPIVMHFIKLELIQMKVEYINRMQSQVR